MSPIQHYWAGWLATQLVGGVFPRSVAAARGELIGIGIGVEIKIEIASELLT
jgi:hypothetical protein